MFGVHKEKPNRGSNNIRRSLNKYVCMRMQASLLASAALTAEVTALKQNFARSEKELGLAKRQLEENKGN